MFTTIKTLLFVLVATTLMLTSHANPTDLEKRAITIPLNQQRCISHSHGLWVTYDIRVGRSYDKAHCDALWKNLKDSGNPITSWSCKRLGGGHMRIVFNNASGLGDLMNGALARTFPYIGRVMPFACNGRGPG